MDPHIIGYFRIGYTRIGVLNPVFERMIVQGHTKEVTRKRRIVLGTRDAVTGHFVVTWQDVDIDATISLGPAARLDLIPGTVGLLDGTIITADALRQLDRVDDDISLYEVATPPMDRRGRDDGFLFRVAGLKKLELEM